MTALCTLARRWATRCTARMWEAPPPAVLSALCAPACALYEAGRRRAERRALAERERLPAFVVSIGNIASGGAGKTPLAIFCAEAYRAMGLPCAILSRGYGGRAEGRVPVDGDPATLSALYGDEPVLMARRLPEVPVFVGKRRAEAGRRAIFETGARVLVLDDGFQHRRLARDLDIVCLDAARPFGNGLTLPCGPLREPPSALGRAHAVVLTRAADESAAERLRATVPGMPVFSCAHAPREWVGGGATLPPSALAGEPVLAFSGIARPEGFFQAVSALGGRLVATLPFPDHHAFTGGDLARILAVARRSGARILATTEKDAVRLPAWFRGAVLALSIECGFGCDEKAFREYLSSRASGALGSS